MSNFPIELPLEYLQKAEKLGIDSAQIEETFIHGSGHGGQKINKTSSCVQLQYAPLGIKIKCQKHRERSLNRLSAYKLLIRKIENQILGKASQEAQKQFKLNKQKKRRSRRAKIKILADKHHHSEIKKLRKKEDFF